MPERKLWLWPCRSEAPRWAVYARFPTYPLAPIVRGAPQTRFRNVVVAILFRSTSSGPIGIVFAW